jgi:lysophospholipase L1-like esterase
LSDGRRGTAEALVAAGIPLLLAFDCLRPALFERRHLEALSVEANTAPVLLGASERGVLVGVAVALAVIGWLFLARRREALTRMALAATGAAVALLLFEGGVRLMTRPRLFRPGLQLVFQPDPRHVPGVRAPARFSTNRLGLRAPEWDDSAYRILCVGGSTTICTYLDDEVAWPWRLMTLLNARPNARRVWTGNAGRSGADTWTHLALLDLLPEARKVDCVVILCGVNDLSHSLRLPPETLARFASAELFDVGGPVNPFTPLFKQTVAYRGLRVLSGRPPAGMDVEDDRGANYTLRREVRRRAPKDLALPDLDPALEIYTRNLQRIVDLCRRGGIRLVLLTQPTLWQDPMPAEFEALTWFRPIGLGQRTLRSEDLAAGMAAFNRALLRFCETSGAECLDLAAAIPKTPESFYDDEHFTIAGSDRVARELAAYLGAHPPIASE